VETLADEGRPLASLDDRAWEQAWEPLIAVASLAGEEWLARGIAAAVSLSGNRDDELDEGVNLLTDIRTVFDYFPDREALGTFELLYALLALEESPWREWWSDPRADEIKPSKAAPRKLARTLKPFGISRTTVRIPGDVSRKGYRLDDFRDAWARYLPSHDGEHGLHGREPASGAGSSVTHTEAESVTGLHDAAQPSRLDPRNRHYPSVEEGQDLAEWLARDGLWRSFESDPPVFPGEVLDTRYGKPSPEDDIDFDEELF
jgi:Protein of unknown function (DUF3631)